MWRFLLAVFLVGCTGGGSEVVVPAGCPDPLSVAGMPEFVNGWITGAPKSCDGIASPENVMPLGTLGTVADLDRFEVVYPQDDVRSTASVSRVSKAADGTCTYDWLVEVEIISAPTCAMAGSFRIVAPAK